MILKAKSVLALSSLKLPTDTGQYSHWPSFVRTSSTA
jgi:hypothetical protein